MRLILLKKVKGKNYQLAGNITLYGVTIPIVFNVVYNGWAVTMTKKKTAGFTVTGKLRLDISVEIQVCTIRVP
jgi:polyisoprenoid-binding protein YceI